MAYPYIAHTESGSNVRRTYEQNEGDIAVMPCTAIFRGAHDDYSINYWPRIVTGMSDAIPDGYISPVEWPVLANKYPIFEWWRIAPYTSTNPWAYPWWYGGA